MSVSIRQLTKVYDNQKAVDNVTFKAEKGEIVGYLGPNGAGKSTTMKIATCLIAPTSGTVEVCGYDVENSSLDVRRRIGYLPEHNPLYYDMYVHEYLQFIGNLHSINSKRLQKRIAEMVDICGLSNEQNKLIGALSKGYRQRVGIAQALIHDPEVLILDEPTTGLDPNQLVDIRNLIRQVSQNKTVIFSTHIMQEVQALCSRVIVINQGKIVADDPIASLKTKNQQTTKLKVQYSKSIEVSVLQQIDGVLEVFQEKENTLLVHADTSKDIREDLFQVAVEYQASILSLTQEEYNMEQVFQNLTKDKKYFRD